MAQLLDPSVSENWPLGQSTQWNLEIVAIDRLPCFPGGQELHVEGSDAPWAELKVPKLHGMHAELALVCLVFVPNFPAEQATHVDDPFADWYRPFSHSIHITAAAASVYLPCSHAMHTPFSSLVPGVHATHVD